MNIQIQPRLLSGDVTPPSSKSVSHRLLIAAALARGASTIDGVSSSEDIEATLRCLSALGARYDVSGGTFRVTGIGSQKSAQDSSTAPQGVPNLFDCGESGSTLRFMVPVALALRGGGAFTGRGRLMERPQDPYWTLFDQKCIAHNLSDGVLTVRGRLTPGLYQLPGDVSSQFFTGLLFALSCLDGESVLESVTPLQSAPYVSMTIDALSRAGVHIDADAQSQRFIVRGQPYRAFHVTAEGDWSQGAFWYVARFLGNPVTVQGLNPASAQGDKVIVDLLQRFRRQGECVVSLADCPDLLPPLAAASAVRDGVTRFVDAARLRMKESDRLSTVAALLQALGVRAQEAPDSLTVWGGTLRGGAVNGANDHRIVMAAAVAASVCREAVTISDAGAVRKSYPAFWEDYRRLGGVFDVL